MMCLLLYYEVATDVGSVNSFNGSLFISISIKKKKIVDAPMGGARSDFLFLYKRIQLFLPLLVHIVDANSCCYASAR
jgi:hypothetical protein